jgi:GT2 family glycosyltransferase
MVVQHPMRLSFIILSHERCDALRACLQHLLSLDAIEQHEVIVLVNGSQDGSAQMLEQEGWAGRHANLRILISPDNLGAGGGRNHAAAHATGDWLVFVDDDVLIKQPHFIARFIALAQDIPTPSAWVFTLLTPSGDVDRHYIPRFDKRVMQDDSDAACLLAGASAMRHDVFKQLGGFWGALDPYGYEDRDLMFRFLAAGHRARWTRTLEVIHAKAEDPRANPRWLSVMMGNHLAVALRHLPWRYVASYALFGFAHFLRMAIVQRQWGAWWQGMKRLRQIVPAALQARQTLPPDIITYCRKHSGRLLY